MKMWRLLIALQLLAAAVSLLGLASFYGGHLLDAAIPRATTIALQASFLLIVALTIIAIRVLAWNRADLADDLIIAAVAAMVVTAAAGYVPRLVDENARLEAQRENMAEYRRLEQEFLAAFAQRKQEIETRRREHRPLTGDDALQLLIFLQQGDFRNVGLADHTPANLTMLRRALEEAIIDPNGPVSGEEYFGAAASAAEVETAAQQLAAVEQQADPSAYELNTLKNRLHMLSHNHRRFEALHGKPLFLFYYDVASLEDSIKHHVERSAMHEWEIVDLLVLYGADLGRSDAAPLVADLAERKARMRPKPADSP
jgi:hypothetical protein